VKKMGSERNLAGFQVFADAHGKDVAMHSKGLELPGYDPRSVLGMALSYATVTEEDATCAPIWLRQRYWKAKEG